MRHLFLINPAAGKKDHTREFQAQIAAACSGLEYEVQVSRKPGDITALARQAAQSGEPLRIYACGGDGTLNEVINGVVGFPHVAITHFPGGSGNDFIKIFCDTAPFFQLETLLDPAEAEFDLISCNDDYALNVCSLGLDARIAAEASRYKRLPLVTGSGAYALSALVNTIKGIHRPYRIALDGEVLDGRFTLVFVGNGRWYGGGFHPMPDADPCDGLLDVLLIQPVSRLQVFAIIGKYKAGPVRRVPSAHPPCADPAFGGSMPRTGGNQPGWGTPLGAEGPNRGGKGENPFFLPKNSHLEADLPGVSVCIECTNGAGSVCPGGIFQQFAGNTTRALSCS